MKVIFYIYFCFRLRPHSSSSESDDYDIPIAILQQRNVNKSIDILNGEGTSSTNVTETNVHSPNIDLENEPILDDWGIREPKKIINKKRRSMDFYNKGQEYINAKGKTIPAKNLGVGCTEKCKRRCKEKMPEDERKKLLDSFRDLGSHDKRWAFITSRVINSSPSYHRSTSNTMCTKNCTRRFGFKQNGDRINVCKPFFLQTLAISEPVVKKAFAKESNEGFQQDLYSGHHSNRPHSLGAEADEIRKHIQSFPAVRSHYCRKKMTRKYRSPLLSVEQMHSLYKKREKKMEPQLSGSSHHTGKYSMSLSPIWHSISPKKTSVQFALHLKKEKITQRHRKKKKTKNIEKKQMTFVHIKIQ